MKMYLWNISTLSSLYVLRVCMLLREYGLSLKPGPISGTQNSSSQYETIIIFNLTHL